MFLSELGTDSAGKRAFSGCTKAVVSLLSTCIRACLVSPFQIPSQGAVFLFFFKARLWVDLSCSTREQKHVTGFPCLVSEGPFLTFLLSLSKACKMNSNFFFLLLDWDCGRACCILFPGMPIEPSHMAAANTVNPNH